MRNWMQICSERAPNDGHEPLNPYEALKKPLSTGIANFINWLGKEFYVPDNT